MTIFKKLAFAFAAVLVPIFFVSSYSIFSIEKDLQQFGSFHTPTLYSIQNIATKTIEAVEESFAYVISGEEIEKLEFLEWAKGIDAINNNFEKVAGLNEIERETEKVFFRTIVSGQEDLIRTAKFMFNEFDLNGAVSAETFHDYEENIDALLTNTDKLIDHEKLEVESAHRELLKLVATNEKILAGLAIMSLALAIIVVYLLSRSISRPLAKLQAATIEVTRGNLNTEVILHSNDEIGNLANNFTQMTEQLKRAKQEQETAEQELLRAERFANIGQMAATVSHELRNPLGTISMSILSLRNKTEGKELGVERTLDRIQRSIHRCNIIIEDLLEFVRTKKPSFETTIIDQLLAATLDEFDVPEGITLNRSLNSGVETPLDRESIRRALINTVDNALQAMEVECKVGQSDKQCVVTVSTRAKSDRLEISIRDTGPGIAPQDRQKIFEPLFSTKTFGVGLGLPIVQRILKQHGGGVDIYSVMGEGTEVVLWIPGPETREKV